MTDLQKNSQALDVVPNIPDYRDFRMAAEWASAVRGRRLNFGYEPETGRMRLQLAQAYPAETPPNATRPVLDTLTFQVEGTEPLPVPPHEYCALLWGESTVEKFLLAYYASCAAIEAPRLLSRLLSAWLDYPGRVMQVCAVALRYGHGATGEPLALEDTMRLVCRVGNGTTLQLLGLSEFERMYTPGGLRGAPLGRPETRVRYAGWPVKHVPDNVVTREAAEFVSGLRGHHVSMILDDGVLRPYVADSSPGTFPDPVISGLCPLVREDRPPPTRVEVSIEGHRWPVVDGTKDPADTPDSMFWTDQAVEDLVLPYYASVKGRQAPLFIDLLMQMWDGTFPPVNPLDGGSSNAGEPSAGEESSSSVYAVTHLPRSEYVSAEVRSVALEHRTHLLSYHRGEFGDVPLVLPVLPLSPGA